jgi:hypothetical protein
MWGWLYKLIIEPLGFGGSPIHPGARAAYVCVTPRYAADLGVHERYAAVVSAMPKDNATGSTFP